MQNYYFFLNQKLILFTDSLSNVSFSQKEIIVFNLEDSKNINYNDFLVVENEKSWIIVCGDDLVSEVEKFKSLFSIIKAAGGLVTNEDSELLFIFRNGKWDLPKGKVEKEESIQHAAVREVEEECGVTELRVERQLIVTYHIYILSHNFVLKETYWYKMCLYNKQILIPQVEEGITGIEWVSLDKLFYYFNNTYDNIRLLLNYYYGKDLSNSVNIASWDRGCES